ncbi:hypothetical protein JI58_03850 [Marinosulfonomonas sp. PRT-SC04]|nr:hypothetical protein JI58_03850 [Marinosulfonomonas sp. PRT-SC04]
MTNSTRTECSNPGRDDYWSCPACYADLPGKDGFHEGDAECNECGAILELSVEHEPVSRARLKGECYD